MLWLYGPEKFPGLSRNGHQIPKHQKIGDFVQKRVKAEFDPDLSDFQRDAGNMTPESGGDG